MFSNQNAKFMITHGYIPISCDSSLILFFQFTVLVLCYQINVIRFLKLIRKADFSCQFIDSFNIQFRVKCCSIELQSIVSPYISLKDPLHKA